jgi:hypothetical protein
VLQYRILAAWQRLPPGPPGGFVHPGRLGARYARKPHPRSTWNNYERREPAGVSSSWCGGEVPIDLAWLLCLNVKHLAATLWEPYYRIIYEIIDDRLFVVVIALGHRREIYR